MHLSGEIQIVALLLVPYPMQITLFIAPSTHLLKLTEKKFLRIKENVQMGIHSKNISRYNGKNFMEGKS